MRLWPFGKSDPAAGPIVPDVQVSVSYDIPAIESPPPTDHSQPVISLAELEAVGAGGPIERGYMEWAWHDGEKYPGGYGPTELLLTDYWTLRQRSDSLFRKNLYARGLVRRLVTNIINTGLTLEAFPDEGVLGVEEDSLTAWSENIESRWNLYTHNAKIVDYQERRTFQEMQADIKLEAYIGGDVLVVCRQHPVTKLPTVQAVSGSRIRTPFGAKMPDIPKTHRIVHGVHIDERGRHVGFWIQAGADGMEFEYIPAYGPVTGRKMAWLVYGTDKRMDDVRGEPLLSLIMQALKELDRYRDAALRKAVINAIVVMSVEKGEDKPGTMPLTGGATRRDQFVEKESGRRERKLNIAGQLPGYAVEEMQTGESLKVHQTGAEVAFGPFEEAIIQAMAWACEIPPEILRLAFSNNYSASQAAINEFKMFLNRERTDFGHDVCQPLYVEWLISEALLGKISAPGLLDAWRRPDRYDVFGAWVASDWSGSIKPSTDLVKQTRGMKTSVDEGWTTNERAARELFGMKFRQNIKRIRRENELKAEAARPLAEFRQEFGTDPDRVLAQTTEAVSAAVTDALTDAAEG